jgi:NAD(P)H dehydrogenase (quinone)
MGFILSDVDYIETFKKVGAIANCTNAGKPGYISRSELACAYAKMLSEDKHNTQTYNLRGEAITHQQFAEHLNYALDAYLSYIPMTVEEYRQARVAELGEFIGTVIAGIYQGIREGDAYPPLIFMRRSTGSIKLGKPI